MTNPPTTADDNPDPPADAWLIVLRPLPADVPAAARVRQLLKRALRDWRLRCVVVRDPTPAELAAAGEPVGEV